MGAKIRSRTPSLAPAHLPAIMPRLASALLPCLLVACGPPEPPPPAGAASGPAAPATTAPGPSGPRIAFETTTVDFGVVDGTAPLRYEFPFENRGGAELVVTAVDASCGCTATELDRTRFAAGQGDAIRVEWSPLGTGRQAKTVDVRSNSDEGELTQLTVRAEVVPFVRFDPPRLDWGQLRQGVPHRTRVAVRCDDPSMRIERVTSTIAHLVPTVVPAADADDPGLHSWLELELTDRAPKGRFAARLLVHVSGRRAETDEPFEYAPHLAVSASVHGELQLEPFAFLVGRVDPGGAVEYRVRVVHASSAPFRVLECVVERPPLPGLRVDVEPAPGGEGYDLVLRGGVGDHLGSLAGSVRVTTDVPGDVELRVPVMGIVRAESDA